MYKSEAKVKISREQVRREPGVEPGPEVTLF